MRRADKVSRKSIITQIAFKVYQETMNIFLEQITLPYYKQGAYGVRLGKYIQPW
jgi:hypothetical protein